MSELSVLHKLSRHQWQALIALHRTLIDEHHSRLLSRLATTIGDPGLEAIIRVKYWWRGFLNEDEGGSNSTLILLSAVWFTLWVLVSVLVLSLYSFYWSRKLLMVVDNILIFPKRGESMHQLLLWISRVNRWMTSLKGWNTAATAAAYWCHELAYMMAASDRVHWGLGLTKSKWKNKWLYSSSSLECENEPVVRKLSCRLGFPSSAYQYS